MQQNLVLTQRQSQIVSQTQVQFLSMLAMCNQELDMWLEEQYMENPMLERMDSISNGTSSMSDRSESARFEPFIYEGRDLYHHLTEQLRYSDYSRSEWKVFTVLIEHLDEKGYFTTDPDAISLTYGFSPQMVNNCLEILRELEPAGIFSPDMAGCLIKQLEKRHQADSSLVKILRQDQEALLMKKTSLLQKKYRLSGEQIFSWHQQLSTLHPYPLFHFEEQDPPFIIPDIICRLQDGVLVPELNSDCCCAYSLSDHYQNLMQQTSEKELKQYLHTKHISARNLIVNIENRRQTLLRITHAILQKQRPFFMKKGSLMPMNMRQIAEVCELSTSTISRAIRDKYLQYPGGIICMKDLFVTSSDTGARSAAALSPDDVKQLIRSMIQRENPKKPLSDDELSARLSEQDITISRRTVAKYRSELFIPTSRERRAIK